MDLCDSCIHALDEEQRPICLTYSWLLETAQEMKTKIEDEALPIMEFTKEFLGVKACRAYASNGRENEAKVLSLVKP